MRTRDVIIFFSTVLSFYTLINIYIFSRSSAALEAHPSYYTWYIAAYIIVSFAWIVGRFLERARITPISSALIWFGSFWLAAMVYFLILVLLIDVTRIVNGFVGFIPASFFMAETKFTIFSYSVLAVTVIVAGGAINAAIPRIKTLELTVHKKSPLQSLNVVAVSDIHLGTIICKRRLERIVKKINSLNPDIVLLPGDVVDEDIGPVIKQNLGETLRTIQSKYGIYAITGNHEYIGGVEPSTQYLVEHGIHELRDDAVTIAGSFHVVGREDVSYNRGAHRRRKPLAELLSLLDRSLPIILMDHQPFRLHEAEECGIDLQLSGHTHHGQMFPFNLITKRIFEVSWGYKKKGNTHIYVSCGVGSWGPPVRIGNTPEIMNIRLQFAS